MNEPLNALGKLQLLLNTETLAALGPEMRSTGESLQSLDVKLSHIFSETRFSESTQSLIRSLVLLWHDYLDESHTISQNLHGSNGSFLHGIMHRREPDYGNAKYWFHRVGAHPCFGILVEKVGKLLTDANATQLKAKLIHDGGWDSFAFIDACEMALLKKDVPVIQLLKQIQKIEFETLLEHFLRL